MNFIGNAKKLDDLDLTRAGQMIGVGEDEVHAVLDVESAGTGFDTVGRPKMLYEPHVFFRLALRANKLDMLTVARRQDLAYPRWGMEKYPKDSYPRLAAAMALDGDIALRSASWGLGQLMGFNYAMAGYGSALDMVTAFMADEENQLDAMIRFIVASGLDDELRRHDWDGFARGYNGPGFAKNGYNKKLAARFDAWQKIKDTPLI
jgi:hypothetical protein